MKIENLQWDNREKGETPLRQMQLVELRLLKIVDAICSEYGLTYYMHWGTLLGAVRHKGFIPWDDDIDLWMPIDDYNRFQVVAKDALPADVFLQSMKTDPLYDLPWIKLRDAYSSAYTDQMKFDSGAHVGMSLDIFPCVEHPKNTKLLWWLQELTMRCNWFARQRKIVSLKVWLVHYPAKIVDFVLLGLWRMIWRVSRLCCIGNYPVHGSCDRHKRFSFSDIYPIKRIQFEDGMFCAPANPENVLRIAFGDYMKLPPEEKRLCHEHNILPFTPCKHGRAMKWPRETEGLA